MTIAESDGMRLAYIAEVTEGTTPATPAWQEVRYTDESIVAEKQTAQSAEIRADKNLADIIATGFSISGGVNGELSYGTHDDWIEAVFRGAWSTNVLINGIARSSFSFEKTTEEGATDGFYRYRGCFIDSWNISASARSPMTSNFTILGLGADDGAAAIVTGATYVAATTTEVMPSGTYLGTVALGGIAARPSLKGFDITFNSNNREQPQIESDDLAGVALGRFEVSGTLDFYVEGIEVYNAIRAHDATSITIPLGNVTSEKYTLEIPNGRMITGDPTSGGVGQDVQFQVAFQGIYDSGESATAKITRAVA